ncbi:MAG: hypothetical protein ACD_75C01386G0003 [uncultured bacterium]|nr:MAG: hypothetical protein ACD_75C01386G0003 [uncultured bacterium]
MPFDYMADLMCQHRNQFVFGVNDFDQSGVEKNETGRRGKGIDLLVGDDEEMIVEILNPGHLQHALAQVGDILGNIWIIDQFKCRSDRIEQFLSHLPLFTDGKRESRRYGCELTEYGKQYPGRDFFC